MPVALTIAGSDSGGGAGIVADAATFAAFGVWPTVAVTAVTAQNSGGVHAVALVDPDMVKSQIEAVALDIGVDAIKTGMLGSAEIAAAVASVITALALPRPVVDPVLVSTSGTRLVADGALDRLLGLAAVVTPNLGEAAALTGLVVEDRDGMVLAARALTDRGCAAALVTGGHLPGEEVADCLVVAGQEPRWFTAARIPTGDTHGTGCVLSAAIAARLAQGASVADACADGIAFVRSAIANARRLGRGPGPVDPTAARARHRQA